MAPRSAFEPMRNGYGSRLEAQRHLKPRRSPGRRSNRFRRRPRSAQEQNDDDGFMTPAFYRARLWPNRSRISAKVGAGGAGRAKKISPMRMTRRQSAHRILGSRCLPANDRGSRMRKITVLKMLSARVEDYLRIRTAFRECHGQLPNIFRARTFSEKIQRRKHEIKASPEFDRNVGSLWRRYRGAGIGTGSNALDRLASLRTWPSHRGFAGKAKGAVGLTCGRDSALAARPPRAEHG